MYSYGYDEYTQHVFHTASIHLKLNATLSHAAQSYILYHGLKLTNADWLTDRLHESLSQRRLSRPGT